MEAEQLCEPGALLVHRYLQSHSEHNLPPLLGRIQGVLHLQNVLCIRQGRSFSIPNRLCFWGFDRSQPLLPARSQGSLQSQARWQVAVSSSVSSHAAPRIVGDELSIRWRGCRHQGCPSPKNAHASGSRRRMTPLSRSAPVLRFVLSGQRFVQ